MHKIALVYLEEIDNEYQIEIVNAEKEGDYYRLTSIPFFAKNLAINDLITVEDEDGVHYFDDIIQRSGHSTIRILFKNESIMNQLLSEIECLGGVPYKLQDKILWVAIDIPSTIDYKPINKVLKQGKKSKILDYQEACLGWK